MKTPLGQEPTFCLFADPCMWFVNAGFHNSFGGEVMDRGKDRLKEARRLNRQFCAGARVCDAIAVNLRSGTVRGGVR